MTRIVVTTFDGTAHNLDVAAGTNLKEAILNEGIPGLEALCGGTANCGTCHVYVAERWCDRVPGPIEAEELMLEYVIDRRPTSRLSCQIVLNDQLAGFEVTIPESQT